MSSSSARLRNCRKRASGIEEIRKGIALCAAEQRMFAAFLFESAQLHEVGKKGASAARPRRFYDL